MSDEPELDKMKFELMENWKELSNEVANFRGKKIKEAGLSFHSLLIVNHLYKQPGTTQSDLSELMSVSKPTTSSLVDTLVRKNLLTRKTDESDRRKITLHLTEEGTALVNSIRNDVILSFRKMLSTLSKEEIGILNSVFRKIRESIGNFED